MNVLVLHYTHPEGYPPTINAIHSISKQVNKITILSTDTLPTKWKYEKNVRSASPPPKPDAQRIMSRAAGKVGRPHAVAPGGGELAGDTDRDGSLSCLFRGSRSLP